MSTAPGTTTPLKPSTTTTATDLSPAHHRLPDEPFATIQPSKFWRAIDFRELWSYRELLYFLTWRDVKVRYKQTLLGAAWAILQPLLTMLIFTLFFGQLAGIPSDGIPYPIFAYAALLPWTFLSNAVTNTGNSLVGSSSLITKVYFPRIIIPSSAVAAGLVDFGIAFVLLIGLMIYYSIPFTLGVLMLIPLTLLTTLLALGVGMWMSALNVKYRDVRYALPFLIQLWMFASPIIYPSSMLPPKLKWALTLNPLTGIIEGYRAFLFGRQPDWRALLIATIITLFILCFSIFWFRRMEKEFADIV